MPDILDVHAFYDTNLPEYERKDLHDVNRAFLELMGLPTGKPLVTIFANWKRFRRFVCEDWQGVKQKPPGPRKPTGKTVLDLPAENFGVCKCGGKMIKRQNRAKGNFFLGCSQYPKCTNTEPYYQ